MAKKNKYWLTAGLLNLLTFFVHLFAGQLDLVIPMLETDLDLEKGSQLVGVWHMVTIILLLTSYILISAGLGKKYHGNLELIKLISYLNLSFSLPFIISGWFYEVFTPQWIFFLPIGLFILLGFKRT